MNRLAPHPHHSCLTCGSHVPREFARIFGGRTWTSRATLGLPL
ncbi:DUF7563 family protein [Haloarchaeobius amylolyticus]